MPGPPSPPPDGQRIHLRILVMNESLSTHIDIREVPVNTTLSVLKDRITLLSPSHPPRSAQRLIFAGRSLADDNVNLWDALGHSAIRNNEMLTLHLVLRAVPGGHLQAAVPAAPPIVNAAALPPHQAHVPNVVPSPTAGAAQSTHEPSNETQSSPETGPPPPQPRPFDPLEQIHQQFQQFATQQHAAMHGAAVAQMQAAAATAAQERARAQLGAHSPGNAPAQGQQQQQQAQRQQGPAMQFQQWRPGGIQYQVLVDGVPQPYIPTTHQHPQAMHNAASGTNPVPGTHPGLVQGPPTPGQLPLPAMPGVPSPGVQQHRSHHHHHHHHPPAQPSNNFLIPQLRVPMPQPSASQLLSQQLATVHAQGRLLAGPTSFYLLSSPDGPQGMLYHNDSAYSAHFMPGSTPQQLRAHTLRPLSPVPLQQQAVDGPLPEAQAVAQALVDNAARPAAPVDDRPPPPLGFGVPGGQVAQGALAALMGPPLRPAPAAGDAANPNAVAAGNAGGAINLEFDLVLNHFWLLLRIMIFAYFFIGSDGGWRRPLTLAAIAIVFFIARGVDAGRGFRDAIRGWWEGVAGIPRAAPAQAQANLAPDNVNNNNIVAPGAAAAAPAPLAAGNAVNAPQAGAAGAQQQLVGGAGPAAAVARAARTVFHPNAPDVQQRDRMANLGNMRQRLRPFERALALFVASLWPGVGEATVRVRREEEERLGREREAAAAATAAATAAAATLPPTIPMEATDTSVVNAQVQAQQGRDADATFTNVPDEAAAVTAAVEQVRAEEAADNKGAAKDRDGSGAHASTSGAETEQGSSSALSDAIPGSENGLRARHAQQQEQGQQ